MSIRSHKDAILARLREVPALADSVHEGVVEKREPPYVAVFTDSGVRESERFLGPDMTAVFSYTVHSVGSTPDQAQWAAEHVLAQLLNWKPEVTGYRCSRLRHEASTPTQLDRDVLPALFFCVDEFDLTSRKN